MRLPILYTMSWPERVPCSEVTWPRLDFAKASQLTFKPPDRQKYPSMDLAYSAGRCALSPVDRCLMHMSVYSHIKNICSCMLLAPSMVFPGVLRQLLTRMC